jgi:hypothetical protein
LAITWPGTQRLDLSAAESSRFIRKTPIKGYTHHASPDDPQYEIKSDKTEHIAMHKGAALRKTPD